MKKIFILSICFLMNSKATIDSIFKCFAGDEQGTESQKVLDLRDFVPGVYTYTVSCGKLSQTGKLVIVK